MTTRKATTLAEQPAVYQVEPKPKSRTLFSIGEDLEKLNELLDESGDDSQQQELISQWFEQLGDERDHKLDNYAALTAVCVFMRDSSSSVQTNCEGEQD